MILFILPTLFIVLLGPAALSIIDTFSQEPCAADSLDQHQAIGQQLIAALAVSVAHQ